MQNPGMQLKQLLNLNHENKNRTDRENFIGFVFLVFTFISFFVHNIQLSNFRIIKLSGIHISVFYDCEERSFKVSETCLEYLSKLVYNKRKNR